MKKSATVPAPAGVQIEHQNDTAFDEFSQLHPELARQIWGIAKPVAFVDRDGTTVPLNGLEIRQYFYQTLLPRYNDEGELIGLLGLFSVDKAWLLGADKSGRLEVLE